MFFFKTFEIQKDFLKDVSSQRRHLRGRLRLVLGTRQLQEDDQEDRGRPQVVQRPHDPGHREGGDRKDVFKTTQSLGSQVE